MSDFRVLLHQGGPRPAESVLRRTGGRIERLAVEPAVEPPVPELVAARIVGQEGRAFRVELAEPPQFLKAFAQGGQLLIFRMPTLEKPFLVSEAYVAERKQWTISPCSVCGFSELFEPPSELLRSALRIPSPELVEGFSWRCPLPGCSGTILVDRSLSGPAVVTAGTPAEWIAAFLEFIREPWGNAVVGGLAVFAMGVGLTAFSYLTRNPQDGIFLFYPRTMVTGVLVAIFGLIYWRLMR